MEEKEFKNYKEKQRYYRERAKQENTIWVSKEPEFNDRKNTIIKGRTYIKPKKGVSEK